MICQLLPLGCIRFCACAASNNFSRELRSENVTKFEKIFKIESVSDFIKEVEDIEVEDGDIAKEARTESFQVEKYKMFVICF